jgi:adenylyltransferase/sulfurtransferase
VTLPPLVEPADALSVEEVRRYSRHLLVPGVGLQGQLRLKNARVLVVGAGGLGSPALLYLAAAGIGTIGIVDDDVVEESNLQRQVVHGQSDLGRPKVDSAADAVTEVNPHVRVVRHRVRLDAATALDVLRGYDLVVDGTDTFATRYLVADACEILGLPCVWGSVLRFDGQVSVFWARPPTGDGVTYRDLFPVPPPPGLVPSCAEGGVLGAICAAVGSVMVTEAVKLVAGIGEPLLGRVMVFDALEMSWRTVRVRADPQRTPATELIDYEAFCGVTPAPGALGGVPSVSATGLAARLAARGRGEDDFVLVDVREPGEHDLVAVPGSVLLPVARFRSGEALAGWDAARPAVLYCKSGVRSAEALGLLRDAGISDAVHLDGGVLAWVRDVDPSLPTY